MEYDTNFDDLEDRTTLHEVIQAQRKEILQLRIILEYKEGELKQWREWARDEMFKRAENEQHHGDENHWRAEAHRLAEDNGGLRAAIRAALSHDLPDWVRAGLEIGLRGGGEL